MQQLKIQEAKEEEATTQETKQRTKQRMENQHISTVQKVEQKLPHASTCATTQKDESPARASKTSPPTRVIKSSPLAQFYRTFSPTRVIKSPPPPQVTKPSSPSQASKPRVRAWAAKRASQIQASVPPSPAQASTAVAVVRLQASHGDALSKKFATYGAKGRRAIIAKRLRQPATSTRRNYVSTGRCEKSCSPIKRSWGKTTAEKVVHAVSSR